MEYTGLIIVFCILSLCFIVMRTVANDNRAMTRRTREFYEREQKANSVRRADISTLPYIEIPLDELPVDALAKTSKPESKQKLLALSKQKILNLSMYTNTDLKMMYGPANLETLSACDEHYLQLIHLLQAIGETLLEAGERDAAESFLAYAISIGSDLSNTYVALGQIYADTKNDAKFHDLLQASKNLTSLSAKSIQTKLNSIKSSMK
ncbi:MAG: hypothetical protein ACI4EK_05095 [Wujia sp.]